MPTIFLYFFFIVRRLFEIVEFSSHHVLIKLRHVVLSFAFCSPLITAAAPSMGLLVGISSCIACAVLGDLRALFVQDIGSYLSLYFFGKKGVRRTNW